MQINEYLCLYYFLPKCLIKFSDYTESLLINVEEVFLVFSGIDILQ